MDEAHLRSLELFEGLSNRDRGRMAADVVDVPAGKDLVREDKFAYEFFVIEEGSAEVSRRDGGHVADLGPGHRHDLAGLPRDVAGDAGGGRADPRDRG